MKIKAVKLFDWLQGEMDAFCSILQISDDEAKTLIMNNKELDAVQSRLANYILSNNPKPINGADALLIALDRAEMKLRSIKQLVNSFDPVMEL